MGDDSQLKARIAETLEKRSQRGALLSAVKRGRDARSATLQKLGTNGFSRAEVAEVKARCIEKLEHLVELFSQRAKERGAEVYLARSGAEACQYVLELASRRGARLITKSKSLTTEEIELNHPLETAGLKVVETDLGERIIQMAGELPYHLVFPAVHKTAEEVAELFSRTSGETVSPDLEAIMSHMRKNLRPIFLDADIGITGANVAIAETGSFLIETNEGNGRLVSALPPVHVCIMGAEKIVESLEDAMKMILAHPVSATGQILTTYVSLFAGRSPLAGDDSRELHIIILDNGRLRMREDGAYREALHCIRCGACMNICPTYGVVGGHVFGYIYPGPIGIPWTAQIHGLENAAKFSDLCISCGLCKEICPADIDIPMMIAKVKYEALDRKPQPLTNRLLMASETLAKLACATAPISNWFLRSRPLTALASMFGIEKSRAFPEFTRTTFVKQFRAEPQPDAAKAGSKIAIFLDYFPNYVRPDLARSAIRLLRETGGFISLPEQKTSGYPFISYGELDKARKIASHNVQKLAPFIEDGHVIVALEPTAVYALRQIYPDLLGHSNESNSVASATFGFFEYLTQKTSRDWNLCSRDPRKFGLHIPCHQRGIDEGSSTLNFLRTCGYDIEVVETGTCCGMAGTFGMKSGPLGYELSTAVGEQLFELFKESGVDAVLTESSVCRMQLEDGTDLEVFHPIELLHRSGLGLTSER